MYARARDKGADAMADEALDMARSSSSETAQADRIRLDAIKWAAAKIAPRRYGDRTTLEHSGPDGAPIASVSVRAGVALGADDAAKVREIARRALLGQSE
jgi:hypothetical protein